MSTFKPPLPAEDPDTPKYWMHETGGELRKAVEAYLKRHMMTPRQIALMRAYLRQWIQSPAWDQNPYATERSRAALAGLRDMIGSLVSRKQIERWIDRAVSEGLDPL